MVTLTTPLGAQRAGDGGAVLAGLLPPHVRGALAQLGGDWTSVWPAERDAVAPAVPARRREFFCGRACAHAALRALGQDGRAIGVGDRRQPLWPDGVVGSITHGGALAAAVVARASDAWGLGLDIEPLEPALDRRLERLLLTRGELARLRATGGDARGRAKIAFSAKESVYKCVFPRTGWTLDYTDVEIVLDLAGGGYRAVIAPHFDARELPSAVLEGRFRLVDGYVISALAV